MLDKSIPYKHILMKRPKGLPVEQHALPDGFSFVMYEAGLEHDWAEIETSVLEFDNIESAMQRLHKDYLPYADELKRRMIFVQDPQEELIATTTVWWYDTGERRDTALHWVAVKPGFQGKGIGKAIFSEGMKRAIAIDGDVDLYLHTQTWSYPAINIYLKAGFEFLKTESIAGYENQYEEAMRLIGDKIIVKK